MSNDDLRDELSTAREELVLGQQQVVTALQLAEQRRREAEDRFRELEAGSAEFQSLLLESETRFETLLSERQSLLDLDESLSSELSAAESELAILLGIHNGGSGGGRVELVTASDILDVGYGIKVHRDIAESVRALLEAAHLDGVNLAGGGYRDSAAQIRVRRQLRNLRLRDL